MLKSLRGLFATKKGPPKNYFAFQLTFWKCLGVDFKGDATSTAYRTFSIAILSLMYGYPVFQGLDVFRFSHVPEVFSVVFLYNTVYWTAAVKLSVLIYNRKDIYKTLTSMEKGVCAPVSEYENKVIKKFIRLANFVGIFLLGLTYSSKSTAISDSVQKRIRSSNPDDWSFPMGGFGAFNVTYSPNYEFALAIQTLCSATCITSSVCADTLIASNLVHLTAQYKLLQHRMKNILARATSLMNGADSSEVEDPSTIPWTYLKTALNECIYYHVEVLDLSQKLENLFTYLFLLQFSTSTISICFTLYCCSLFPVTDGRFIHYMQATGALTLQVLIFCYWGNEVALNSVAVGHACHQINYVGTDVRFQKGLQLIILRSQRPVQPTAGKFAVLSLNTFVSIMRASYSYYTLMASR